MAVSSGRGLEVALLDALRQKECLPTARAAPAASYAMLGFGQPAAPEQNSEQAAPSTGSGRAAAQEAARRIREQS